MSIAIPLQNPSNNNMNAAIYSPHRRLMLVNLLTLPCPLRYRKHSRTLHHERDRALGNAHLGWGLRARGLELLVRDTVGHKAALIADASRLEGVAAAGVLAVNETHEFRGGVAVVVGRAVGVANMKVRDSA